MKKRSITIWLFTGCFLVFLMVIIGGITRLTGSGLSIVEWNLISGAIPPLTQQDWEIAFEKYKQFPEFIRLNPAMDLSGFKFIFFWEYTHRLLGRITGFAFIIPLGLFLFQRKISLQLGRRLILIFVLGALQGFMGWFMVKSGLADSPHVSHYRLAAHFLLACLLISVIFVTALETMQIARVPVSRKIYYLMMGIVFLIAAQLLYGAFTAGLKAGFAYNTFPKMNGKWIPDGILVMRTVLQNFLDNGIAVQFMHRLTGSILLIWVSGATIYVYRFPDYLPLKRNFMLLSGIILLQYTLGVITLLYKVPVVLGVIHQAMAVIVLLIAVFVLYLMKRA